MAAINLQSADPLQGNGGEAKPASDFLTFLHLSDIHFRHRQGSGQFDLEAQLRKPLLDDIKSKPAGGADYDGIFITGDIAFSGKKTEYEKAKKFLEEIYTGAGVAPEHTFVIPGNHDVDRSLVVPNGAIWNNHSKLREATDKISRRELLQTQLTRDPACDPLAPLAAFNEFAQGYGCRTERDKLAWSEIFPLKLSDGSVLRIHGLNSALNSDEADAIANLYIAPFQTQHFSRDIGVTDLLLCHHPPNWMLDKMDVEGMLNAFIRVALFGHEHQHRLQRVENTVQLFAGAVHPATRDPDWMPTYHVIQLQVDGTGTSRRLIVRIYSRELRILDQVFVSRTSLDGKPFEERKVELPEWRPSAPISACLDTKSAVSSPQESKMTINEQSSPAAFSAVFRELLVHFHRLSTPIKYKIATDLKLLRDGDDVPPQQQWDLIFRRAKDEQRLSDLWKAVASNDSAFARRPNPYD